MVVVEVRGGQFVVCQPTYLLLKVFTGKPPSSEIGTLGRPRRPSHSDFTESLWSLTQRCWSQEAQDRPNIREVIEVLKQVSVPILLLNDECITHVSSQTR